MLDDRDAALPAITPADVAAMAMLLQVGRLRSDLGMQTGAGMVGQAVLDLETFWQVSMVARAPGMPWDPEARTAVTLLRRRLQAAEPTLSALLAAARPHG